MRWRQQQPRPVTVIAAAKINAALVANAATTTIPIVFVTVIALLVNPINPNAETLARELQAEARSLGLQLDVFHASSESDFDAVFANLSKPRAGALAIGSDAFFNRRSEHLGRLALQHGLPTIHALRPFAVAGGLMSYGGSPSRPSSRSCSP